MILKGIELGLKGATKVKITVKISCTGEISAVASDKNTSETLKIVRPKQFTEDQLMQMKKEICELAKAIIIAQHQPSKRSQLKKRKIVVQADYLTSKEEKEEMSVYCMEEVAEVGEIDLASDFKE